MKFGKVLGDRARDSSSSSSSSSSTSREENQASLLEKVSRNVSRKVSFLDCVCGRRGACGGGQPAIAIAYSVPWPQNLVVGEEALESYNLLFGRFLAVQRANHELLECWKIVMRRKIQPGNGKGGGGGTDDSVDKAKTKLDGNTTESNSNYNSKSNSNSVTNLTYVLRSRIAFFVGNLLLFLKIDVAAAAYSTLVSEIKKTDNFDDVRSAHLRYLSHLRLRSFLDSERLSSSAGKILVISTRFCEFFRGLEDLGGLRAEVEEDFVRSEMEILGTSFDEEVRRFLDEAVARTSKGGEQFGGKELVARLNFNDFFSNKIKP